MNMIHRTSILKWVFLSMLALMGLLPVVFSTPLEPPEGLVSWWPGDGHANDIIGVNNGDLRNGTTFIDGFVGQAFRFDGIDDYVWAQGQGIDNLQRLTIETWIYLNVLSDRIQRFVTLSPPGDGLAVLRYDFEDIGGNISGQLHFYMRIGANVSVDFTHIRVANVLQSNTWYHVAGTYDGNVMRLYLDGEEIAFQSISGPIARGDDHGVRLSSPDEPLDGLLDETSVYDHALTATEIASIYAAGAAGKRKPAPLVTPEVAIASTATAAVGISAAGYYMTHQGVSSVHVEQQLRQQQTQELQQQAKKTTRRLRRRKQRPRLEWTITAPDLIATTTLNAIVSLRNIGTTPIQHLTVKATAEKSLHCAEPTLVLDTLAPKSQHDARFAFHLSPSIRKGVYPITITLVADTLPQEIKRHHLRVAKIGYLASTRASLQPWLTHQSYLTHALSNTGSRLRLLRHDVIIVPPEYHLSTKETQNLSDYVEDGNALLIIGQPEGDTLHPLATTLGYLDLADCTVVDAEQGTLMFQRQHPLFSTISKGTPSIVLGHLQGSVCTSTHSTGQVLAKLHYAIASRQEQVPAIVTNHYGQGKTMHVTLPLDLANAVLSGVLANAMTWLISYPQVERE